METAAIIGRTVYKSILDAALEPGKASLVAIYGRRRVGKTFLVKTYLHGRMSFQYQGIHNVTS